jgi:hypothetical protein
MVVSHLDVMAHVLRLVDALADPSDFVLEPEAAVSSRFGITVESRPAVSSGCSIAGSYNRAERRIIVERAMSRGRERFTVLHELGHALADEDTEIQDWLFGQSDRGARGAERLADAFAAEVLVPTALVDDMIPDEGPSAFDVATLAARSAASREAVCVRASQRLRSPGAICLVRGAYIQFTATRMFETRVPRDLEIAVGSFFARAVLHDSLREDGVRIDLGDGRRTQTLLADAYSDDGFTFVVLQENSAPWAPVTPVSEGPDGVEFECPECDRPRWTFIPSCRVCGDWRCPDHGCSCATAVGAAELRRTCASCGLTLPSGAPRDLFLCDNCA